MRVRHSLVNPFLFLIVYRAIIVDERLFPSSLSRARHAASARGQRYVKFVKYTPLGRGARVSMDDDIFRTGLISQARIEKPMLPDSLWIDLVMIEGGRGGETILWILVLRVIIIP